MFNARAAAVSTLVPNSVTPNVSVNPSANNPAMVACWLAETKAGAVVVNTMPMLRAGELGQIVDKAEIALALCDTRLMDEIVACALVAQLDLEAVGEKSQEIGRQIVAGARSRVSKCASLIEGAQ